MTEEFKKYGHPKVYEILERLKKLHSEKNRDYADEDDPLGNFKRVGEIAKRYELITPGNEALKIAIIYALKQFDAALWLLKKKEKGLVEGIDKRLEDMALYMVLSDVLYGEVFSI